MAIGPYAYSAKEKTAALGYGSKAIGREQSMALGYNYLVQRQNSIAIGVNSAVKVRAMAIKETEKTRWPSVTKPKR